MTEQQPSNKTERIGLVTFIGMIIYSFYHIFLMSTLFLSLKASIDYYLCHDERSFSRLCIGVIAAGFLFAGDNTDNAVLWFKWWEQVKNRLRPAHRARLAQQQVETEVEEQDWADRLASPTYFIGKHVLRSLVTIGLALHMYALWCVCTGRTEMLPEIVWGLIVGSLLVTIVLMMLESIRWIINRRDRT